MRAGQRESGRAVIERGSRPIASRVANRTICREACSNMVRNRGACQGHGAVPFRGVASVTGCGSERVVVADVTGDARCRRRGNIDRKSTRLNSSH